jgi:hypothetical protein
MLSKATILIFAAATIGSAISIAENIDRQICCSVILPSTLIQLKQNQPDISFPNTHQTDDAFFIYQDVNGATG